MRLAGTEELSRERKNQFRKEYIKCAKWIKTEKYIKYSCIDKNKTKQKRCVCARARELTAHRVYIAKSQSKKNQHTRDKK